VSNTIYVSISKQNGLFRQLETSANNVANVDTKGFKRELMIYNEYPVKNTTNNSVSFANDIYTATDASSGNIEVTSRELDVSIQGKGFFVVNTPLGVRYTRAGNFTINKDGALATSDQYPVLGVDKQPIVFQPGDKNIVIGSNGVVRVNGEEIQTIAVVDFDNMSLLEPSGKSSFKALAPDKPAENFTVVQGALEGSNVNSVMELKDLVELQRSSGSLANLINLVDDLQRTAVRGIVESVK
jgi:flagellar basal-body rod protein FlgF